MEFAHPWALLGGIPILIWIVLEFVRERRRMAPLPFPAFPGRVVEPSLKVRLRWIPAVLRFVALLLLVLALARPQVPSDEVPIKREGLDIIIAFDISTSMMALDFEPADRFTVARQTIADFVKGRTNDRVGLVVFAGEAFTQCPLTLDHSVLLNIINSVRMEVIADGTAIGDALATSVNRLRDSEAKSKVVVLLTDGSNNRGSVEPLKAAELAAEFNVRVHTIQVGRGGVVPYPARGRNPFTGEIVTQVQQVQVPVNPELLRSIADTTKGSFFVAGDSAALKKIFDEIDRMETTELPGEEFTMVEEAYSPFALIAFCLLVLDLLLRALWLRKFP